MRVRSVVAEVSLLVVAACHGGNATKTNDAGVLDVTMYGDAAPRQERPPQRHDEGAKPFACRIVSSDNGPAPGADATAWITLADKASFSVRSSETTRELRFEGPGRVRACGVEVPLVVAGTAIALPGGGEAPGAETWVATPCGVVRWAAGVHRFSATPIGAHGSKVDCKLRSSIGTAYLWLPPDGKVEAEALDGGVADAGVPDVVDGWRRIDARRDLHVFGTYETEKTVVTAVSDCEHAMDEVDDLSARLADAGTVGLGDLAAKSLVSRRNARAACALAAARVAALESPDAGAPHAGGDAGPTLAGRVEAAMARLSSTRHGR